ncbi:protein Shroom1 isoform X2 [Girardinichthys multiradiatus]|uniref:protein Shroom1 isoform X2 n=1 Tax=Girardinichthys multiradiatus TaxID=208333 RepID=UPI001FAC9F64|nr:protein Shroom1 isoform X2 [Girardinichthys multiradiatus]
MDSYSLHFERMSNVDLHPLSLSVSRLSPAKSNTSIVEHLAHHQHGKGDSAYSSFSGGSTAPDNPSPFLPDDLQSSSFSHYADLKYIKSVYHPTQFLQSDSKTMDQLYRSVEAISHQYRNNTDVNYHSHNSNENLHTNNNVHSKKEVNSKTPPQNAHAPAYAPPVPARLDSFIATKNLENSRVHLHGTEFKPLPQQPQQQLRPHGPPDSQSLNAPRSETVILDKGSSTLNSEPMYSVWRGSHEMQQAQHPPSYRLHLQLHNQTRKIPEKPFIVDNDADSESHRSANALSRSPPQLRNQPEHLTHKPPSTSSGCNGDHQNRSSSHFQSERKRAHSAQEWCGSEPQRAPSPWNSSQSFLSSSIQHKGQFYFVTGVYKPSESGMRTHSATVTGTEAAREVSAVLETHRQRDNKRSYSTMDNFFRPLQESSHPSSNTIPEDEEVFISVDQGMDLMSKSLDQVNHRPPHVLNALEDSCEIGRHTASNPIFYCGPDRQSPLHSAAHQNEVTLLMSNESPNYIKREDHANRGNWQPLEDVASERINKETTPLLYHLTGASRTVFLPKVDPGFSGKREAIPNKSVQGDVAVNDNERPAQGDTSQNHIGEVLSVSCGTLDDSFKKYYKEKLKDAQCKVLRETSFKRRDLQLPWPHCLTQTSECRPAVIHSFSSSQDSEISTDTLTPSLTSEDTEKGSTEEIWENLKEIDKAKRENLRLVNVAQPQVGRIGSRKRLTLEQKKMCFSEPEKLNLLGGTSNHSACRSFGNESEGLFAAECEGEEEMQQTEQGLVAARRKMFESRGRALSVSSVSKANLKHLQYQALMEYMGRKTGQKVAELQLPTPHLPTPSRQRHSLGEKPFDWGPRPQSGNHEKHTNKKHHRPHSAGRILDSSSSSIRYAQFFSAQSCSGHYPGHQNPSKLRKSQGPSQGKSASAESLLDQQKPASFLRNRSKSTPHTFQAHGKEEDPLPVNTMETQSCQKNEAEEPSEKRAPEGQQRPRKVGQRGKSMEELGASKLTKVSGLSKSSEHLDRLRKDSAEPAGVSRNERSASNDAEDRDARRPETRKEAEFVGPNNSQVQSQHQTQKNPPEKQDTEQGEDATGERSSGRSIPSVSSGELSETFSNPPSPRGQKISEWELKSGSSTPTQTKLPCESTPISRGGTSHGLEREQKVDESSSETNYEVSLSCGVTTDPSLWILPPEKELKEDLLNCQLTNNISDEPGSSIATKQTNDSSVCSSTSVSEADVSQQKDEQKDLNLEAETVGEKEETEERGTPEGETDSSERSAKKPKWEELVKAVVKADHSLVRVLCPLANRKTALMLMEQLLSEDTLLMEEHYKKKQEQKGTVESSDACKGAEPSPCPPDSDSQKSECTDEQSQADITEKKRLLVCYINEHLRSLEESRGALQTEVEENAALGEAMKLLVHEHCLPMELERYNLFIGDLERVVNLLLCLSARLARVQNALSVVDQHTDAEEKESLDSRHRLLCKQREDAKDLKDNLDRRENLVSTFLSRQLSAEQLQDYRRFVQTKASLLIRQKDLEEKQRLGEEQLEALSNSLNM